MDFQSYTFLDRSIKFYDCSNLYIFLKKYDRLDVLIPVTRRVSVLQLAKPLVDVLFYAVSLRTFLKYWRTPSGYK